MNTTKKVAVKRMGVPSRIKALVLGIGLVTASSSFAVTWQYQGPYNATTAIPNGMTSIKSDFPAGLVNRILARLPESGGGSKPALALLTDDIGANITLKKDATITVAFVAEGAGYKNALAYFQVPTTELATVTSVVDKIIFPNFSGKTTNGGGDLVEGDAVNIGSFTAGSSIGFTVVADGWDTSAKAVKTNQSAKRIFRTIKRLNPEVAGADNKNAHTVLLSSPGDGLLILGIEDLNRTNPLPGGNLDGQTYVSDEDFNDAIIAIKVTPFDAIDTGSMQTLAAGIGGTIPSSALSTDGKKVNICHFPPGNPDNYQIIDISVNALNTHIDHHDDVFAVKDSSGTFICPPIPKATTTPPDGGTGGESGGTGGTGGESGGTGGESAGAGGASGGESAGAGGASGGAGGASGGAGGASGGAGGVSGDTSGAAGASDSAAGAAGAAPPNGVGGRLNWKEVNKP